MFERIRNFFVPAPVHKCTGEVSPNLEVTTENGRYVLNAGNANYSYGGLHQVFRMAFRESGMKDTKVKNVLILGFGAGSVASILLEEYYKECDITGVEKDPVVLELARMYFDIDRFRGLSLHCIDAVDFVMQAKGEYDLIVVDVFVGLDVPSVMEEEKFLLALGKLQAKNGRIFFNKIAYSDKTRKEANDLVARFTSCIAEPILYKISMEGVENWVFFQEKR